MKGHLRPENNETLIDVYDITMLYKADNTKEVCVNWGDNACYPGIDVKNGLEKHIIKFNVNSQDNISLGIYELQASDGNMYRIEVTEKLGSKVSSKDAYVSIVLPI